MLLKWRKKKSGQKKSTIKNCEDVFNNEKISYKKDDNEAKRDINEIRDLYINIKDYYYEIIKEDNNFIVYEKIRLEKNLGKYTKGMVDLNMNFFIAVFSAALTLLLDGLEPFESINISIYSTQVNNILNYVAKIVVFFVVIFGFLYNMANDKGTKLEKNITILNNIKLRAIDDIEKELEAKKKLDEIQLEDKNPSYEVLKEIAITTSTGVLTNIVGSGIIGKVLKKK